MSVDQKKPLVLICPLTRQLPELKDVDLAAVDGGLDILRSMNITPIWAIGDFDSGKDPVITGYPVYRHPVCKDETDTELALMKAEELGYKKVIVYGALGGRLDHTLANLRLITWRYPQTTLMDERQRVSVLCEGEHLLKNEYRHVSFFAMEPTVITLEGFDYPLDHQTIDQKDFYTCSNSISKNEARVIIHSGRVICVETDFA